MHFFLSDRAPYNKSISTKIDGHVDGLRISDKPLIGKKPHNLNLRLIKKQYLHFALIYKSGFYRSKLKKFSKKGEF